MVKSFPSRLSAIDPAVLARATAALAIGAIGGAGAAAVGVPLPWMLGSMGACMFAVLSRVKIATPSRIVNPMRVVLGVLLGSTLTPDLLSRATEMAVSVALLVPYILAASLIGFVYFTRVGGVDRNTAFFSATPGGLYTMTAYAEDVGADASRVALMQAARIVLVVMTLPFAIRWLAGAEGTGATLLFDARIRDIPLFDAIVLTASALAGWWAAAAARMPGAAIVGPMFASSLLHLTGLSSIQPPGVLVIAAQVVLGTSIGARFSGIRPAEIARALVLAAGFVLLMLVITVAAAFIALWSTNVPLFAGILAYAPGGLTEMSLVAFGLGFNVGYVATLHFLRILMITLMAPVMVPRAAHHARGRSDRRAGISREIGGPMTDTHRPSPSTTSIISS